MPRVKKPRPHLKGEIVALDPADLEATYCLDQVCFPPGIAFDREVFSYCLQSPDCLNLGLKDSTGCVQGFIIVQSIGQSTAQLITIDVQPNLRRQGVADRLMAAMETILRRNRFLRIYLQVAVENTAGQGLYQKWGFEKKHLLKDYYGPGRDALMMVKNIGKGKA